MQSHENILDYSAERLADHANYYRDVAANISQKLAVWLVIGNIAATGLLISYFSSDEYSSRNTIDIVSAIHVFVGSAGAAFLGMWVNSIQMSLLVRKYLALEMAFKELKIAAASTDDRHTDLLKHQHAQNYDEFQRLYSEAEERNEKAESKIQKLLPLRWWDYLLLVVSYTFFILSIIGFISGVSIATNRIV